MSGNLNLKLVIDGSNTGAIRALTQVVSESQKTGGALTRLDMAAGNFGKTRAGLESISTQLARVQQMAAAFAGFSFGAAGISDLVRLSDSYTSTATRIKLASTSTEDFKAAQQGVFAIAQRNGQAMDATGTLYGRIAGSVRALGKDTGAALAVTEAVAASLKISGASAAEAASAQLQLAQGLGAGALRGDEFNSVMESSPRLAQALADGLGVPIGALRKLAEEGRLTTQVVTEALLSQKEKLVEQAAAMEGTIGQSLTNVRNAFSKVFGERTTGGAGALARGINEVALNLEQLINVATLAGAGLLAVFGTRLLGAIGATIAAKGALITAERNAAAAAVATARANVDAAAAQAAHTLNTQKLVAAKLELAAAERASAAASVGVAARVGQGALGLVGGPVGLVTTALSLGITAWELWGNKGVESAGAVGKSVADLIKEMKDFDGTMGVEKKIEKYGELAAAVQKTREEERKAREEAEKRIRKNAETDDTAVINDKTVKSAVDNDPEVKKAAAARIADEKAVQDRLTDLNKQGAAERANLVKLLVQKQKALNGELVVDEKKALETRVAEHVKAAEAVRQAWQKSLSEAAAKRAEAEAAPSKAASVADNVKSRVDAVRQNGMSEEQKKVAQEQAAAQAGQDAQDARTRASFELQKAYSQQLRGDLDAAKKSFDAAEKDLQKSMNLAEKAGDANLMEEVGGRLVDVEKGRGQVAGKEAGQLEQQAEAQRQKMLELEGLADSLKNKLAGMEVDVQIDGAIAKIRSVEAEMNALDGKKATNYIETVHTTVNGSGAPAAPVPADAIPARAYGGPLPGSAPHDRADNMMYWGTPGEWVIQRPAVRHYGSAYLAAVNAMQLPKYAFGGQLGQRSAINRLAIPSLARGAGERSSLAPVNFHLGGQQFPMQAAPDVIGQLTDHFRREALRIGGRG